MSEEIQWRMNNEWHRHSSANYPSHYVLTPSDWVMNFRNTISYQKVEPDPYIVIPETDYTGEHPVYMATIPDLISVKGVATGSAKLKSTQSLFHYGGTGQYTIELDYFFTPDVEEMPGMFESCEYEYLDLRSFDTTKCSDFMYMFWGASNLITLDISSFDIRTLDDGDFDYVDEMFGSSAIETVYVKNQQIADYLDMYGGKPGINFIVGSST